MSTEPNGETAAVLYDLAREVVDDQAKAAAALDTKAFQTFTIGTVVLGIVAVSSEVDVASAILLVGAVLAYVVATYYALMGLAPRKYRATRQLGELLERYASGPPTAVHLAVVRDLADGVAENAKHNDDKGTCLRGAITATAAEAAFVVAAAAVTAFS